MSQNKVQFQKGLSLENFLSNYGTEEKCVSAVFKMRWPEGFSCEECGHSAYREERHGRLLTCLHCYHPNFLTAGTIFQDTKLPLTKWFLAMHLLTKDKQGMSALQLMRELGVCYETAWSVKQKLMTVMQERVEEKPLSSHSVADDLYIGGKLPDGKRGRGSENKVPVVGALSLSPEGKPDQVNFRVLPGFTSQAIKTWAAKNLARGIHLYSDGLACFTAVTEMGIEHYPTVMSENPEQRDQGVFGWVNTVIGNLKTTLAGTYHHVSAKYVSRYLAEFEYRFNRRYNLDTMLQRLLHAAIHTPPYPQPMLTLAF
jgi:hypothetical protein